MNVDVSGHVVILSTILILFLSECGFHPKVNMSQLVIGDWLVLVSSCLVDFSLKTSTCCV